MKTVLFIPTYRLGGLDVLEASLARQTVLPDYVVIADELWDKRSHLWEEIMDSLDLDYWNVNAPMKEGYKRNLAANYNLAAHCAIQYGADLFISLQDYIWIPHNGIERFIEVAEKCPSDLITGLTSISVDPRVEDTQLVHWGDMNYVGWDDRFKPENFYYSIFHQPYVNKPKSIGWLDCRIDGIYEYTPDMEAMQILPEHWESNWAAVPVDYFRAGVFWDEEYDKGIAYENMDFAQRAIERSGRRVIMDTHNHAISLPHKKYFAGEEEVIINFSNKDKYEERWGS